MNQTLKRLIEERQTQATFIEELLAHVEAEGRDLVQAERQNLESAEHRMAELDEQIAPLQKFEERRAAAVVINEASSRPAARPAAPAGEVRSLGTIFTDSEQFRSYNGRGTSGVVTIPEFRAVGPDPLLTTTEPGLTLLPNPQKVAGPSHYAIHPLLALVGRITVTGNSITYVTTSDASGADVVAEGAQKPPVVWTASEVSYTLETIAGWFKYSRQALADIPAIRDLIDQKIRRAIDVKLNALATGALNGAFSCGNTVTGSSGTSMIAVIREAMADLEADGIPTQAILMNPADRAAVDIEMLGKPLGAAQVNGGYWGVPVLSVPGIASGTAVVGNISDGLVYFQREGLEMYTTDSDVDDAGKSEFRANILTTLGEVRGKFAAVDPAVLRKVVVTP